MNASNSASLGETLVHSAIPRFDYREQYHLIKTEILQAIDRVLESGNLILGPRVSAFESAMCEWLGHGGHAVGVASGTDAIAVALRALNVGAGDEVITVANTAIGTVSAIRMAGATPVFCDIDPATLMMDVADAARRITRKTRAIVPVHLFGNAVDMVALGHLAQEDGLWVIEDCAQSCGTMLHGRATGTWGDAGCFSFYPTKNLGAYGDGGLCFTRNRERANSMQRLRNHGCDGEPSAQVEGVNSRLDELQAAILQIKLKHLPAWLAQRRRIADIYTTELADQCAIPATTPGASHSHHLFVIRVERRNEVIRRLAAAGIECGIHYPIPIHLMPAYRFLGYDQGSLPHTEAAAQRVLSLPCYPELDENAAAQIADRLCEILQHP